MGSLIPKPEVNDFWDSVDQVLHILGIHCGLPRGAGEVHITTRLESLAGLLQKMNPETSDERQLNQVTDVDGEVWKIQRCWTTKRPWKGELGLVVVARNERTRRLRTVFVPRKPWVRRYGFFTATLAMRTQYTFLEAELKARSRLFEALSESQRRSYTIADTVAEKGRSGIVYLLRKDRPTLAIRIDADEVETVLCALCLHPTGYYTDTWAGVTPPSDEILTHLLMIRSSEYFYWRKANQIPLERENSGI